MINNIKPDGMTNIGDLRCGGDTGVEVRKVRS